MATFSRNIITAKAAKKSIEMPKKVVAKKNDAPKVSLEERQKMIEREAYFIAEKHGFQGNPQAHWIEAVKKIDAVLAKKK
jgi:hypothetical protein